MQVYYYQGDFAILFLLLFLFWLLLCIYFNFFLQILSSDPDANEEEKLKTLREMHQSLTIKRQVKERLDADRRRKTATHTLRFTTRFKLGMSMVMIFVFNPIKMKGLKHSLPLKKHFILLSTYLLEQYSEGHIVCTESIGIMFRYFFANCNSILKWNFA